MGWTKTETNEAREYLREMIKPGDTLHTVMRNVSRSGMTRSIDVYHLSVDERGEAVSICVSRLVAKAAGLGWDNKREAIKIGGCGMDMGFAIVYDVSHSLFSEGFSCIGRSEDWGRQCPSNDHSNGDRDYTPHVHKSGGYALRHAWL